MAADTLRITETRAAELARLDREATPGWVDASIRQSGVVDATNAWVLGCNACPPALAENRGVAVAARNALPDLLADRETLLRLLDDAEGYVQNYAETTRCANVRGVDEDCGAGGLEADCAPCDAREWLARVAALGIAPKEVDRG